MGKRKEIFLYNWNHDAKLYFQTDKVVVIYENKTCFYCKMYGTDDLIKIEKTAVFKELPMNEQYSNCSLRGRIACYQSFKELDEKEKQRRIMNGRITAAVTKLNRSVIWYNRKLEDQEMQLKEMKIESEKLEALLKEAADLEIEVNPFELTKLRLK